MGDAIEDTIVRIAGVTADDSPRPQVPGKHGVEFRSVEADLGQKEQKSDQAYNDAKLAIRRRTVADLVLNQARTDGNEQRKSNRTDECSGKQRSRSDGGRSQGAKCREEQHEIDANMARNTNIRTGKL